MPVVIDRFEVVTEPPPAPSSSAGSAASTAESSGPDTPEFSLAWERLERLAAERAERVRAT